MGDNDQGYSPGGIYWEIQDYLAAKKSPVQREIISMLATPGQRLVRCLIERAAQLETFEQELTELQDYAAIHSIPNFGRF